ncbi:MAG TPA: hypothetical protein VFX35_01550 [Solirubrobacterales bacterium]|nr:hypothetical protein [Solirubrobacterales bacterium]
MTPESQPERKARPWLAILITVVLLALAVQAQLKSGHIDAPLIGGLVVLAFFWAGQTIDRSFPLR